MFKQKIFANFETQTIKKSLWDYFDAFILVIEDVTVTPDDNIDEALTNCALFPSCKTEINDLFKQNNCTKFDTETIKQCLWDFFHTFTLIPEDIKVKADNNTDPAFKTCTLFSTCETEI